MEIPLIIHKGWGVIDLQRICGVPRHQSIISTTEEGPDPSPGRCGCFLRRRWLQCNHNTEPPDGLSSAVSVYKLLWWCWRWCCVAAEYHYYFFYTRSMFFLITSFHSQPNDLSEVTCHVCVCSFHIVWEWWANHDLPLLRWQCFQDLIGNKPNLPASPTAFVHVVCVCVDIQLLCHPLLFVK